MTSSFLKLILQRKKYQFVIVQSLPPENETFLTSHFSQFSKFWIGRFSLISNYGDIEEHSILQGIKIIKATSVINHLS